MLFTSDHHCKEKRHRREHFHFSTSLRVLPSLKIEINGCLSRKIKNN